LVQPLLQWKRNSITYSDCVCRLNYPVCNAPYCHLWPARMYDIFPYYLRNATIFEKKGYWTWSVGFDFLYKSVRNFFIVRRNEWDLIKNVHWSLCKYLLFLSDFNESWIFSTDFKKMFKYQTITIRLLLRRGVPRRHMGGRTDMTKLIFAFRNFEKEYKNLYVFM
jgi:hypothetical protein